MTNCKHSAIQSEERVGKRILIKGGNMSSIERFTYWIVIGVLFVFCIVLEINNSRKEQIIKAYDIVVTKYSETVKDLLNQNLECEFNKKNANRVQALYNKERR